MIYAAYFIIMFILLQTAIIFPNFSVNIWIRAVSFSFRLKITEKETLLAGKPQITE